MGTTLTGTTPQDTYDSLIKVTDNGPLSGTAKYLSDGLGNDSKLSLSTSGVGIGTTSILGDFSINNASEMSAYFFVGGTRYAGLYSDGSIFSINSYNSAALTFSTSTGTSFAERMRITSAGNVGIGTSSPATKLEVNEASGGAQVTISGIASTEGAILNLKNRAAKQFAADRNIVQIDNYLYTDASTTTGGMTRIKSGHTASGVNSSFISFSTSPNDGNLTERVRVTNDGLTFNGDTAAANALDDYEEGTWTPVLRGAGTAGTYEQATTYANYTKIGRQVSANAYIAFAASVTGGGSGYAQITGLPFSKSANQQLAATAKFNFVDFGATTAYVTCEFIGTGSTPTIYFTQVIDNASPVDLPISAFGNNSVIQVSLTYFV